MEIIVQSLKTNDFFIVLIEKNGIFPNKNSIKVNFFWFVNDKRFYNNYYNLSNTVKIYTGAFEPFNKKLKL